MPRGIAVLASLLCLGAAAASAGGGAQAAACKATLANQLATTRSATQLITVVAATPRSTVGSLRLWRKLGDCWLGVDGPWPAHLGRNGVSADKHEGDKTTPAGAFGIQPVMYGVGSNPGVRYRYHRVVCGDWWVEDARSPFYNRFHHVRCGSKPPFRVTSEDMSRSPISYRSLAVIDYNTHPIVPGRGSGIFLHVSARGYPTLGCVSLARAQLVTVLRWLDPAAQPLIVIGTAAAIRRY
ncbi:MAG TPA: L,D-transpeptidase family protein [Gaiellaceae bacterium]|nr:L,D-transpeptidase family protein [Gaiellaceae bacterium]